MVRKMNRPVPRDEFAFDKNSVATLKSKGLRDEAIEELEETVWRESGLLFDARKSAQARPRLRQLKSLRQALETVITRLDEIEELMLGIEGKLWNRRFSVRKNIEEFIPAVDAALSEKGKPGNVITDLDVLVYHVARTMLNHGIVPKRPGKDFPDIVEIVFHSIGVDPKSIDKAIETAWTKKLPPKGYAVVRFETIEEMIERRQYGEPSCYEDEAST